MRSCCHATTCEVIFIGGDIGLVFMPMEVNNSTKFSVSAVPLFILMGGILLRIGIAFRAIGANDQLIARVPGRLSIVDVVGGTFRSALNRWLPYFLYALPLGFIFAVVVGSIFFQDCRLNRSGGAWMCRLICGLLFLQRFNDVVHVSRIRAADFCLTYIGKVLMGTARITAMIPFIIAGSLVFSKALANSDATSDLLNRIVLFDLTPLKAVLIMMVGRLLLEASMNHGQQASACTALLFLSSGS